MFDSGCLIVVFDRGYEWEMVRLLLRDGRVRCESQWVVVDGVGGRSGRWCR